MSYIARAAVQLENDVPTYEKNTWHYIKTVNDIEYRWRLLQDLTYEVVAGVFEDKNVALKCAKSVYVTLLYTMLKTQVPLNDVGCDIYESRFFDPDIDKSPEEYTQNENFFFWSPKYIGGSIGVGVYEVEKSIDDFDNYQFISFTLSGSSPDTKLNFENVDEYTFTYCRRAQKLLTNVTLAERTFDLGMKMTIYCGLLEHLAESGKKDACILAEFDGLIEHIKDSGLSTDCKNQIINYLSAGKEISARQKCKNLIAKYAKTKYGSYTANQIFDAAYSCRSAFSHGDECDYAKANGVGYTKHVVLDVIKGYMIDMEKIDV